LAGSIQQQTQQQTLHWLIGVSQSTDANYEVRSITQQRIKQLKAKLEAISKFDPMHSAHYQYAIERIKSPEKVILSKPVAMAPGAPIGCDLD